MMTSLLTVLAHPTLFFAAVSAPPARGAALDQVAIGTVAAMLATSVVIWIAMAHREGRITWLARLGASASASPGCPRGRRSPRRSLAARL